MFLNLLTSTDLKWLHGSNATNSNDEHKTNKLCDSKTGDMTSVNWVRWKITKTVVVLMILLMVSSLFYFFFFFFNLHDRQHIIEISKNKTQLLLLLQRHIRTTDRGPFSLLCRSRPALLFIVFVQCKKSMCRSLHPPPVLSDALLISILAFAHARQYKYN